LVISACSVACASSRCLSSRFFLSEAMLFT
jgi:hypothetical protein